MKRKPLLNEQHLTEQIKIQDQIIKDLLQKINILENENNSLKKQELDKKLDNKINKNIEICNHCGKLYLFVPSNYCSCHE